MFVNLLLFTLPVIAQRDLTPEEQAFYTRAMSQINTRHTGWVRTTATEANTEQLTPEEITRRAGIYGQSLNLENAGIDALISMVMILIAGDSREDLKLLMKQMEALRKQKQKLGDAMVALEDQRNQFTRRQVDSFSLLLVKQPAARRQESNRPVTRQETEDLKLRIKKELDSISETGEMQSLKLQMITDRMNKMMNALSNLMKKISGRQDSIIANLK